MKLGPLDIVELVGTESQLTHVSSSKDEQGLVRLCRGWRISSVILRVHRVIQPTWCLRDGEFHGDATSKTRTSRLLSLRDNVSNSATLSNGRGEAVGLGSVPIGLVGFGIGAFVNGRYRIGST